MYCPNEENDSSNLDYANEHPNVIPAVWDQELAVNPVQDSKLYVPLQPGQLPIVYSEDYNISLFGLESLHSFDSRKWGRVFEFLKAMLQYSVLGVVIVLMTFICVSKGNWAVDVESDRRFGYRSMEDEPFMNEEAERKPVRLHYDVWNAPSIFAHPPMDMTVFRPHKRSEKRRLCGKRFTQAISALCGDCSMREGMEVVQKRSSAPSHTESLYNSWLNKEVKFRQKRQGPATCCIEGCTNDELQMFCCN